MVAVVEDAEVFKARTSGDPGCDPEHAAGITYPIWFWEHRWIPQEELEGMDNHTPNTMLPNRISGRKWMDS